jgi:hypothetical protein
MKHEDGRNGLVTHFMRRKHKSPCYEWHLDITATQNESSHGLYFSQLCVCACARAYTSPTATERTVIFAAPLQHISLSWELAAINIHNTIAPYSGDKRTVNCELMALVEGRDDDLSGFRKPLRRVSRFVGSHCPVPIQPISMLPFSATCCSRVQIKVQSAS